MKKIFSANSSTIIFFLSIFGFELSLISQPVNNIVKNVTQPTPGATAFGKYGEIPVSLGSGLANIGIPIYDIQEGPLSHPISLSYHGSGVKVGEMASWVDQNWNLNAGGLISRTVMGIPDEWGSGYWNVGTSYSQNNNLPYLQDITNGVRDGEPDIFSFSAGSYSGKFFIDRDRIIRQLPVQDIKIEMVDVYLGFIIILPNGTRYIFGKIPGASTTTHDYSKSTNEVTYVATSFHLLRIETQDQKFQINFNYTDEFYGYKTLASCKYQIVGQCSDAPAASCSGTGSYDGYHYFVTTEVNAKRLSSISYSTGSVTFVADTVRDDLDMHNGNNNRARRLDRIDIASSTYCKRFNLYYTYFEDNNYASSRSEAKRLKLDRIRESSCNQSIILPDYKLEYEGNLVNGKIWLPHRLHKGVDHWGFYNGATGNESILVNVPPTIHTILSNQVLYGSANRESDYTYMIYGALKKITYPTGGSTSFIYEGNTHYTLTTGSPTSVFSLSNCPSPLSQSCCGTNIVSAFRTLTPTELSSGSYKLHLVQTVGTTCASSTYMSVLIKVFNGVTQVGSAAFNISSGSQIVSGTLSSIGVTSSSINYKYELTTTDGYGKFEIISTPTFYANKVVGGLRIKEIRTNDGINGASTDIVKTYDYLDEGAPTQSSGVMLKQVQYTYYIALGGMGGYIWSGETVVPSGSYDAYHIGYRKIRENHNGNGKTIWTFDQNLYTYTVLSNNFPFPPYNGDAQTGKMTQKSDYSSGGTLLRQETYTYSKSNNWSTTLGQIVKASDVICTGNYPEPPPPPYPHNYFLAEYQITIHGLRTMTTTTLLDGVSTISTNEYDATSRHMAPVASYFTNSDGLVTRSEFKYPVDMSAGAVKDTLIKRNILVPWESIKKVNSVQVDGERTNFGLYSTTGYTTYQGPVASGGHPYPSSALRYEMTWIGSSPQAGNWVTKGTFDNYDLAGNPRQFTMANWPQETYEWQNGQIKKRTYQNFISEYTYFNNNSRLLTSTKNIDGQIITYSYDSLMRVSTISSRGGNVVTTNSYNYYSGPGTYNKITSSTNYTSIPNSYLLNKTEIKYLDGLGRLVETVRKHPTTGKDVAFANAYDAFGRVSKEFISFEGSGNTGAFISVPGTHPNKLTTYEPSPLNRIASVTPPSWYATTYTYGANTTNEVNLNGGASFYSAGTINKSTSTDAQGNISHTYKDKKGLTVMTRKVNSLDAKTLYDYDDKDRLIMVVPPDATAASTGLIFTYTYDAADRMTQKKVPDANAVNMTYNIRDQLAFMQDGNLSILTKYLATQYDDYGRVIKTGFSTSTSTPLTPTFTEVHIENYYDGHNGTSQVINLTTNPQYRSRLYFSKTKILGSTNDILTKTFTYDSYGRTTNITGNNHLALANSSAESLSMAYDFDDNNTTENRTHTNGINTQNYNQRKVYDELARFHDYNISIGGTENLAARYEYNYRNELIENNQHWGGAAWLQSIDYAYNNQGWLTTINSPTLGGTNIAFPTCTSSVVNPGTTTVGQDIDTKDLFYMQLQYDVLHSGISGTLRKDGSISQKIWRVRGRERQAFSYAYDGLQRITTATYSDINDAGTVNASNRFNTSYTYADLRGNIGTNVRNGLYLNGGCYTQAALDNMTYSYSAGTNKISSISDAAMSAQGGFRAASGGYTYDANGNLLTNGAKGITSISYNHLNLPTNITITGGKTIDFTYTADGTKLRKVVKTGATINLVMEYVNGIEYRGTAIPATTLEAVYFGEGRLYNNSGTWKREYVIKDHLGNTRIAYCDINGDGVIAVLGEILQENNYDAFGYGSEGVYMNHANADNLYQYNGKELNGDHGLNMYDYGARWYDPAIGRFSTVDPLADPLKQIGTSPYAYTANNPIRYIDPTGMIWEDPNQAERLNKSINSRIESTEKNSTVIQARIGKGGLSDRKLAKLEGKLAENSQKIELLYQSLADIKAIGNAAETYKLSGPSASDGTHGVVKGSDGVIKIEGGNSGIHIHEIRHVGQSIEAGGVKFNKDGKLLNSATTLEGGRNNEVNAYQTQYSFDGSYPVGASSLKDINGTTLMNIKTPDGRRVYDQLKDKNK